MVLRGAEEYKNDYPQQNFMLKKCKVRKFLFFFSLYRNKGFVYMELFKFLGKHF